MTTAAHSIPVFLETFWEQEILPTLADYIRIPNKSVHFDPDWAKNGHMDRAIELVADWCRKHPLPDMKLEVHRLPGRTPVLLVDVPGNGQGNTLVYGHLDKQPEFTGWAEGLAPWEPVRRDDKLYGRGGADDGYAIFASFAALHWLLHSGRQFGRTVMLIECSEESGSPDLPAYMEALSARIGKPELVVALDSMCGNYDQFWSTTSLRGNMLGTLKVEVLTEGVHSGAASGIVPSSFRILRELLDRVENSNTGEILPEFLKTNIPTYRVAESAYAAEVLNNEIASSYPFVSGMRPVTRDYSEQLLNNTWRTTLCVTGVDGMPALANAGNTLRPYTAVKLSLRLPPDLDAKHCAAELKKLLERDPPYGAKVTFDITGADTGWNAPAFSPKLNEQLQEVSQRYFGKPAVAYGCGGTIPFMRFLSDSLPDAQFVVTGVLGPHSNAHGPNEFLHIPMVKKITACVADLLAR
ncbi:MAG TPA: M20/M25/M40 family metallo-hydrolase [Permianibacter sp.]|nr:M20/M25/M40 family metallo-hydrolase [Permianibacter sp.]